jgi:hypothetical protein
MHLHKYFLNCVSRCVYVCTYRPCMHTKIAARTSGTLPNDKYKYPLIPISRDHRIEWRWHSWLARKPSVFNVVVTTCHCILSPTGLIESWHLCYFLKICLDIMPSPTPSKPLSFTASQQFCMYSPYLLGACYKALAFLFLDLFTSKTAYLMNSINY